MWSFGCILYELLRNSTRRIDFSNVEQFQIQKILYPGNSCYPISPIKEINEDGNMQDKQSVDDQDQINLILKSLCPQTQ